VTPDTLRRTAAAALAALLLAGCQGDEGPRAPDPGPLPPGTQAIAASARLPAPPVTGLCYSPPVRVVIRSAREWDDYWIRTNRRCTPPPVPAGVEFGKEMLVFAAIGKRMSPRDRVSIDGSGVRNDSLIVVVRRTTLQDGCPGPRQPVYPQSLVKLPADARPVRFSEAHMRIPCE
jgi:hypothetical protein